MTKLYIIGNGFDKFHGLPTGYDDFHRFVLKNNTDVENIFEEYFLFRTYKKGLWSDFESDLGTFKWQLYFDEINNIDTQDESFRPSFIFGLEDDIERETNELVDRIKNIFEDWLEQINIESSEKKYDFEEDAIFLNFNYTLILENVYKVASENIFHIHGSIENGQGLIFGHNKDLTIVPEIDENGDSNRTMFTDSESASKYPFYAFQKPVTEVIAENELFFKRLEIVEEVIILGHSLNPIDIPYFDEIRRKTKDSIVWKISFYEDEEKRQHMDALKRIGIEERNINLFRMNKK